MRLSVAASLDAATDSRIGTDHPDICGWLRRHWSGCRRRWSGWCWSDNRIRAAAPFVVLLPISTAIAAPVGRRAACQPTAFTTAESKPSRHLPSTAEHIPCPTIPGCRLGRLVATAICRWDRRRQRRRRRREVTALMRENSRMGIHLPRGNGALWGSTGTMGR